MNASDNSNTRGFPADTPVTRRFKLIACEILYREMCAAVAHSCNQVDVEFLPKGLHNIPSAEMLQRIQAAVDRVDPAQHEAVLLGYALCNNGLAGLVARTIPLVLPRAHDCITLFLGSKERYREYFDRHPGVYFETTGWLERGGTAEEFQQISISHQAGMGASYEELVAKYGEDNARFLFDQLCNTLRNYDQFTFIEMGLEPDDRFERHARDAAKERGWKFEKIRGDPSMIQRLANGEWDDREFLVVPPGWKVVARYDEAIIAAEKA